MRSIMNTIENNYDMNNYGLRSVKYNVLRFMVVF
ncbi:hypothetical protein SAMN04488505_10519 [Chitinophaga rupis]|uniref:Uncharacterized protein n=1 Tax=Chitinophaga rupis TaxID=573321 RepID=A0A1H7Z9K6_9BACT|nr:hypothetical protein SAMN04488505_10519 [Chitinophaga rupis]